MRGYWSHETQYSEQQLAAIDILDGSIIANFIDIMLLLTHTGHLMTLYRASLALLERCLTYE